MVVVAFDRTVRLAGIAAFERSIKRFLGAGFPRRSCNTDDLCGDPRTRGDAKLFERTHRIRNQHMRPVNRAADNSTAGAAGKGLRNKTMPVRLLALHCEEQVARPNFARVKGNAVAFEIRTRLPAGCHSDFRRCPKRAHAAHSLATSTSSNG